MEPTTSSFGAVPVRIHGPAPSRREGHRAAVFFFHGLRASGEVNDHEARAIAAGGMTAILPDAPHHGARRSAVLGTMPDTATPEGYRTLLRILREGRDEVPSLVDHALGLGYEKVAIAGVSMGAYIALAAATVEPRLAAIVSILGSPDWTPRDLPVGPDLEEALKESPHLRAAVFPPRPLLLLNAAEDESVPAAPARELAKVLAPSYRDDGAALVHREYPGIGHAVPEPIWAEMLTTAVSFLARALA